MEKLGWSIGLKMLLSAELLLENLNLLERHSELTIKHLNDIDS
jgi:hypothetical protein